MGKIISMPIAQAQPSISETLKPFALQDIVVKLLLGAKIDPAEGGAFISFFDQGEQTTANYTLAADDVRLVQTVAARVKRALPAQKLSVTLIMEAQKLAQRFLMEEILTPGAQRVIYYPSPSAASAVYRCRMPAWVMNRRDRVTAFVTDHEVSLPQEALDFDVVVIQLDASLRARLFARKMQEWGKKVVFEIDDAFDCLEPWHPQYNRYSSEEKRSELRAMMGIADCVTVTTEWMKTRYADLARRIEVIPNFIDWGGWPATEPNKTGQFRILWAGSPSHEGDLEVVRSALERFGKGLPLTDFHERVRFLFIGHAPTGLDLPAEQIIVHPFCAFEEYPAKLASMRADVAIAPLADIDFNRAKSDLKILEYGACGYPVIASDVEPYRRTIRHGENGLLCRTESDWLDALARVHTDAAFREKLADGAEETAKKRDVEGNVKIFEAFFGSLK